MNHDWHSRALAALARGDALAAEALARAAMTPGDAEPALVLGVALQSRNDHPGAVVALEDAYAAAPSSVPVRHHLALSHRALGNLVEAERLWRSVLHDAPHTTQAQAALGNLLRQRALAGEESGRCLAEARTLHERAFTEAPDEPGHAHNLFSTLAAAGAFAEASRLFVRAASQRQDAAHLHELAARALVRTGHFAEAQAHAEQALRLAPSQTNARISLATAAKELGQTDRAEAELEAACREAPGPTVAAFNLAQLRCYRGRWAEGFAGFAADRAHQVAQGTLAAPGGARLWDGQPAPDAHLLLVCEQGLGDTLQFIRYAACARALTGRVTVVPPRGFPPERPWLASLLRSVPGVDEVVAPGAPWPRAELFVPLFSLPHVCGPLPERLFAPAAYLQAEPRRVAEWAAQLGPADGRLRVAVAWQGNPQYQADARRSAPLAAFAPLVAQAGGRVRWLSVQKNHGREQLAALAREGGLAAIEDWGARLDEGPEAFIDTAAFLMNVDGLVSTDTALPHLAGALGRPTSLLLAHVPDWRWQERGTRSPFYPSLQLFRQAAPGDWASALARVAHALSDQAAGR